MLGKVCRVFIAVWLLCLGGCMTTSGPSRWGSLPVDQSATLFGTITVEMSLPQYALTQYTLRYRNIDTGEEAAVGISTRLDAGEPDVNEANKTLGRLFDVKLPPGRYEFYQVHFASVHGPAHQSWTAREPFSVPFTIEVGKTHYIGEIRGFPVLGKNVLGMTVWAGGYFVVTDREARDRALLEKRRGGNLSDPVVNLVPYSSKPISPFLRSKPTTPFGAAA